jgi:hypothetical protein
MEVDFCVPETYLAIQVCYSLKDLGSKEKQNNCLFRFETFSTFAPEKNKS